MRAIAAIFLLLLVAASPLVAAASACPEGDEADCCALEGPTCACCSLGPRATFVVAADRPSDAGGQPLGTEFSALPYDSFPRDILHVPRPGPAL